MVLSTDSGNFNNEKKHGKGLFRDSHGNYFAEVWDMNHLVSKKEVKGPFSLEVEKGNDQDLKESQGDGPLDESPLRPEVDEPYSLNKLPYHEMEINDYNDVSPNRPDNPKTTHFGNSRVGFETLSLQEFKENLGSFEDVFEDTQGTFLVIQSKKMGYRLGNRVHESLWPSRILRELQR